MPDKGHQGGNNSIRQSPTTGSLDSFVLDKGIFSNIFEKDIRRVYFYKKAERLAKAIHLIVPAFAESPALRNRLSLTAVALVDGAILPPASAREALSRELLALSSILSIARSSGIVSPMNADLIAREAHQLLQEIAGYEEPRLFMDDVPSLAELYKLVRVEREDQRQEERYQGSGEQVQKTGPSPRIGVKDTKGHIKDSSSSSREEAILAVLKTKGPSYIKDISTVIRDVSEKTIQRELQSLVLKGSVTRTGERRWTTYTLAK